MEHDEELEENISPKIGISQLQLEQVLARQVLGKVLLDVGSVSVRLRHIHVSLLPLGPVPPLVQLNGRKSR